MILAAGRGERLRPLTDSLPKALVNVDGESLLENHLRRAANAGIKNAVINLDWLGEQIVERVGDGQRFGLQVTYSPEYGNVLETAGGIQRALPMLGDQPFWVINADVYTNIALPEVTLPPHVSGHLLLTQTPPFKSRGDFDLINGMIAKVEEPTFTFSGIAYYRPEFFAELLPGRAPLGPMLFAAAERGELSGELINGAWEDIGTPERLENARRKFGS